MPKSTIGTEITYPNPLPRAEPLPPSLPHTTAEKAALCDGLLPFLSGFAEAMWHATGRQPTTPAGADIVYMAQLLLADVRRLLRGERMAHYIGGLHISDDLSGRFGLAVKLSTLETAVTAFRSRYFGWHPMLKRPAWYLCGEDALEEARRLLPREATREGDVDTGVNKEITDIRDRLAERIEQLKRTFDDEKAPLPLHRPGGPEASAEIVLGRWPAVE